MTVTFVLGFLAAAVVLQIIRYAVNTWQCSRKARSLGCANPPLLPSKDLFGISTVREILKAGKEQMIPPLIERRYKTLSEQENRLVTTMRFRSLGEKHIHTMDPKNIQAVLATQFKDFELGPPRQQGLRPFLGVGIVSRPIHYILPSSRKDSKYANSVAVYRRWTRMDSFPYYAATTIYP